MVLIPRIYTVEFEAQTLAAASGDIDLFEFTPADDKPIELVALYLGQSSELAEAQEEQLRLRIIRGHATSGSGGAAPTPRPLNSVDTAAGFTAETANSTIASTGTAINLHSDVWPVRGGYVWGPMPQGMGIWCSQTDVLLVVRMMSTAADDLTASGTAYVIEYP